MKFRKKPVVIEAKQWFKHGDHNAVDYYRNSKISGESDCVSSIPCQSKMHDHGWIDTPEGGHNVCPGDWIITGIAGELYPCKPHIFSMTYEAEPDGQ